MVMKQHSALWDVCYKYTYCTFNILDMRVNDPIVLVTKLGIHYKYNKRVITSVTCSFHSSWSHEFKHTERPLLLDWQLKQDSLLHVWIRLICLLTVRRHFVCVILPFFFSVFSSCFSFVFHQHSGLWSWASLVRRM